VLPSHSLTFKPLRSLMSPASQWFSKRIHSSTPKSPTSDNFSRSASADKLSLHSKNPDSFKFINFASVIGRKSKKSRPTIAIPDSPVPPLVSPAVHRSDPPSYTNRPPAKSVSSTVRSADDSLEPRTPSDVHRDRGSLPLSVLTLSDPDPFAAGAISVPRSILDRGRLSVYSSTSANNVLSKGDVDLWQRPSSASTSSQSHGGGNGGSTWSPLSSKSDGRSPWSRWGLSLAEYSILNPYSRETTRKSEIADEQKSQGSPVESSYLDKSSSASLSKYGSLSTLTAQNRKDSPDSPAAAVLPTISTRGYTETSSSRSTSTVSQPQNGSPSSSTEMSVRSRALGRQQSTSDVAPASLRLSDFEFPTSAMGPSSSSSIPFTSSNRPMQYLAAEEMVDLRYRSYNEIGPGLDPDFGTLRQPVKESSRIHVMDVMGSSPVPPAVHRLKKSMSHSTLQKAKLGSSNSDASQVPSRGNKDLKRQYSFHHSRRDAPTSTPAPTPTPPGHDLPSNEGRKQPPPHPLPVVRKRLFSGSNRRPSTAMTDEDLRSVFSLPTEAELSYATSTRAVESLHDEASSEYLASGMVYSAAEFAPQRIMSPAEMLKVEAIVQDEFDAKYGEAVRNRQRGISSPSIPMYGTMYTKEGLSAAPTSFPRLTSTRNAPNVSKGPTHTLSPRPSSAQTSYSASMSPSSSTTLLRHSLRPQPRPLTRPHTAEMIYDGGPFNRRTSTVPFTPLSPPPPRLKRPNRAPSVMSDRVPPQRSVMRKPSFLEIADEANSYDGSFLEFDSGKESFELSQDFRL
jgi:hypothetical protein